MSRKPDPNSPYRIAIHSDKGYRYASTQPAIIDPETGKRTYRRIHWGTVDENNRFIPGKEYIFASLEERSKLIFPDLLCDAAPKFIDFRKQWSRTIHGTLLVTQISDTTVSPQYIRFPQDTSLLNEARVKLEAI